MNSKPNVVILGEGLGVVVLVFFLITLLTSANPWIVLLDNANLLIHESGHMFFSALGETLSFLGGSLIQLLVPAGVILYFKYSGQAYASGFGFFWLGDSLVNVSVYIKDARTMLLPLVNGGIHDWNWMLTKWGLIKYDLIIGNGIFVLGAISAIIGVGICAYTFYKDAKLLMK